MYAKKFLNISDFAKISGVSRQTLIYYDRIGLFSPSVKKDNNYRLYSHNQVDNIGIITILSDLGVSLKKIKEILADISVQTIEKTLNYQLAELKEKIEKLTTLKQQTQIRLEQIAEGKKYLNANSNVFTTEITEDIPIRVGNKIDKSHDSIGDETILDFFNSMEKNQLPLIFSFGYEKKAQNVINGNYANVSCMWFRLKDDKYANAHIRKGKYIVGYCKGDYGKTDYIYKDIINYATDNKITIFGNVYEEYLIDELSEKNPENFVVKIMAEIK